MKPEETIRTHFKLLRAADREALATYHCNLLHGYLQALRDTRQLDGATYLRLNAMVTAAWCNKINRIYGIRRAA